MKKSFPIFGILIELSSSAKKEAGTQLFINVLFSTVPIWLVTFIFSVQDWIQESKKSYFQALVESLHKAISNGELLMYAVAALGPLIQVVNRSNRDSADKAFPHLRPILVVAFVVVSMASSLFFYVKKQQHIQSHKYYSDICGYLFCFPHDTFPVNGI